MNTYWVRARIPGHVPPPPYAHARLRYPLRPPSLLPPPSLSLPPLSSLAVTGELSKACSVRETSDNV
eukprot:2598616-Rhodomonas_salina.1